MGYVVSKAGSRKLTSDPSQIIFTNLDLLFDYLSDMPAIAPLLAGNQHHGR